MAHSADQRTLSLARVALDRAGALLRSSRERLDSSNAALASSGHSLARSFDCLIGNAHPTATRPATPTDGTNHDRSGR